MMPRSVERLDPGVALRSGRFDPVAVLVLWYLRKSFYPLLWLGLTVATIAGRADEIVAVGGVTAHLSSFDSVGEIIGALLSPLAIVIIAIGLRFAVAGFAFALAYPLTRWNRPSDYGTGYQRRIRVWWDRWYLTRAYRALRWSWVVRQEASSRLGALGRRIEWCGPALFWANIMLLITYLVVAVSFA